MRLGLISALPLLLLAGLLSSCEVAKSESPLSPTIAGPIAGVVITPPVPLSPNSGAQIAADKQPVKLVVVNAETTGVRPLSYTFEIALDSGFASKVFNQTGVTPSGTGQTTLVMPEKFQAERTYYWRTKAEDGANASGYSDPVSFRVFTPVSIGVPGLRSPDDGATVTSAAPTLEVDNVSVSGPASAILYQFVVAKNPSMADPFIAQDVSSGSSRTSFTVPGGLLLAASRYYWRVRAFDSGHTGDWSPVRAFTTPALANVPTTPNPPPSGGGGPAPNDAIDLRTVTIARGEDITNWAVTSTVTNAYRSGNELCIDHTQAGRWPRLPFFGASDSFVEGNHWLIAKIGGKWYGGASEWLRPGQVCKDYAGHIGQGAYGGTPMENWTPSPGETIYVLVSTPARAGQWGTAERSNIVLIKW